MQFDCLENLSEKDKSALGDILKYLSVRTHRSVSLQQLTADWDRFVSHVEEGYSDSIYEYTNDLSIRDLLEKLINGESTIGKINRENKSGSGLRFCD
jgi:hypothetical protein